MNRNDFYSWMVGFALAGAAMMGGSLKVSHAADGTANFELYRAPMTPQAAPDPVDPVVQDRLINDLYSHYVDCLDTIGSQEACYRKWSRDCKALFQGKCPLLEEKMFPTPADGDESC